MLIFLEDSIYETFCKEGYTWATAAGEREAMAPTEFSYMVQI